MIWTFVSIQFDLVFKRFIFTFMWNNSGILGSCKKYAEIFLAQSIHENYHSNIWSFIGQAVQTENFKYPSYIIILLSIYVINCVCC